MKTPFKVVAVLLLGLAVAGCCGKRGNCPPGEGQAHAAGDNCCPENPKTDS